MIKYALTCSKAHSFDSWFASADAFETLKAAGHVACAICGDTSVDKAIMAPQVRAGRDADAAPADGALRAPASEVEEKLAALRQHVEQNATYVGGSFANEARAMHDGDAPDRPIWGEANAQEAKKLLEDGVPVAPLPFVPSRKAN